ncbi:hypothetical protein [Rhizobium sp. AG855]|uniref:hypothetical protein n=1 Tax=Rhizobium sp. AG855 TaxID=2183898 RepID=UPI000E76A834|nr:hypothetical protein [Rhizobium sp. AG855]RKE86534.1 hypothetical protein DFO46_3347 [Rhizobium sp. AG855]
MIDLSAQASDKVQSRASLPLWIGFYSVAAIAFIALLNLPGAVDYVGADNDDVMRLVEVRDLLAGQSWFDLMQYRLGLDGGTLMHWSRLIDLPIALLIRLFSHVVPGEQAEALALLVWPLSLVVPLMTAMAVAARRIGSDVTMHVVLMFTAVFCITSNRFLPGAIDHHNVQMVLAAIMAAGLLDPARGRMSHAVAGLAAAVALAIGAETTPLVAAVCAVVGLLWVAEGPAFTSAARSFSLTLLLSLSALFFATVPPARYGAVTCDSLSIGFYAIVGIGAAALYVATYLGNGASLRLRSVAILVIGALVLATALTVAPQCLQNPLNELDPLLQNLWLSGVIEAQSFRQQLAADPQSFGGFYAVGFFGIAVCLFRIAGRDGVRVHLVLLALLAVSYLVALVQVRGSTFSNLFAILPLSLLISDLRLKTHDQPEHLGAGLLFALTAILSVPSVWILSGVFFVEGTAGVTARMKSLVGPSQMSQDAAVACDTRAAYQTLAKLLPTTVAAPSDIGPEILRFTRHRVLTGPYHRNQGGMLTEIHIGLAKPDEAAAFLRGAGVGILAFCPDFLQSEKIARMKPDGLYAQLLKGNVPAYLTPVPIDGPSGLQIFTVTLP